LPIPHHPWIDINVDFILGLSHTQRHNESVMVVVDHFCKMTHFVPCNKTYDASNIAFLFLKEIVRLHGLPTTIISNHDVKFISYFWKTLWAKLGTKLAFSSAFHPQTNGQTEVVNRSLGNLLRCLIDDHATCWDLILPQAEFAYNNSVNHTTGSSQFQLVYGMTPHTPLDTILLPLPQQTSEVGLDFATHMKSIHEEIRQKITLQTEAYAQHANLRK